MKFANNFEDSLPVTMVDVDTPYVKGRVTTACLTALAHDLILGNPDVVVETRSQGHQTKIEPQLVNDPSESGLRLTSYSVNGVEVKCWQ